MTSPLRDAESATAGVPVVRKLEWQPVAGVMYMQAETAFGEYIAYKSGAWSGPATPYTETDGDMDAAKAAAQADCDRRTLSNINPNFLSELDTARAEIGRLRAALAKIERWELPRTGRVWNDNAPPSPENDMSYGALYGSNGERDFMRQVARDALTTEPESPSALTAAQARIAELEGASAGVIKSWDDRQHGEIEQLKHSDEGGFDYWSPSASMVDSRAINALRRTLSPVKENDRG